MGTPLRSEGRLRAFRLSDVPITTRYRAADRLLRGSDALHERAAIMLAATHPSDKLYFVEVADAVWERVMKR